MKIGKWWEILYPIIGAIVTLVAMAVYKETILSWSLDYSNFIWLVITWMLVNVLIYINITKVITNHTNDFIVKLTNLSVFKRYKRIVRYDMLSNGFTPAIILLAYPFHSEYFAVATITALAVRSILALYRNLRCYNLLIKPDYADKK